MHQHQWLTGLGWACRTAVSFWASHAMSERPTPLSSVQGGKEDVQGCLAKSAGLSNCFVLCFSTFSRWSRLPIRKKSCLGRLSHSTIMNLFWWVRGLTEDNCSTQLREESCCFCHGEEMHLGKTSLKGSIGGSGCPVLLCMCVMCPFSRRICFWPSHLGSCLSWMNRVHSHRYAWARGQRK